MMWAAITAFAGKYFKPLAAVLLAGAVTALTWGLYAQIQRNGALQQKIEAAVATQAQEREVFEAARRRYEDDMKIVYKERDEEVARLTSLAESRKELADAPQSDDGLAAPVLLRGIYIADELRRARVTAPTN